MTFRYADHEPFPLQSDFIATVEEVTKAAVALCKCDAEIEAMRDEAREAVDVIDDHLASIQAWMTEMGSTRSALNTSPLPKRMRADVLRGLENAALALQDSTALLKQGRNQGVNSDDIERFDRQAKQAIESLINVVEIPNLTWQVHWDHHLARTTPECRVEADFNQRRLCNFSPRGHAIPERVRVCDLVDDLVLAVPIGRSGKVGKIRFDKWWITEAHASEETIVIRMLRSRRAESGYELRHHCRGDGKTIVRTISLHDAYEPDGRYLAHAERESVSRLAEAVEARISAVMKHEFSLKEVDPVHAGQPIRWRDYAEVFVAAISGWLREVHVRSGEGGELVLKRDMPGGRREERFLPLSWITEQIESLPSDYHDVFERHWLVGGRRRDVPSVIYEDHAESRSPTVH